MPWAPVGVKADDATLPQLGHVARRAREESRVRVGKEKGEKKKKDGQEQARGFRDRKKKKSRWPRVGRNGEA